MKFFMLFINTIFWLWAFIVPAGISGFFAFLIYANSESNLPYSILISIVGVVVGIWIAETIRKKYGLSHFFSRIMATPELDAKNDTGKKEA